MIVMKTISEKIFSFFKLGFSLYTIEHYIDTSTEINFLDVGFGSSAPANTVNRFPKVNYYGIDIVDHTETPEVQKYAKKFIKRILKMQILKMSPMTFLM